MANKNPAEKGHREGFHEPIDEERDADAAPVSAHLSERPEIYFDEHRNDHHPDQNANRQVHLRDREMPDELKEGGEELAERDARHYAEKHPHREVAFEAVHGSSSSGVLK